MKKKSKEKELTGVKEIASRANVSIATVDRVLHNRLGVSQATKNKILAIIKELNYQPNILARALASKKTLTFAILIPGVSSETAFWRDPLNGILKAEAEIKQYGINVVQYLFDQTATSFASQAEKVLQDRVDAVLMAPMFIQESINLTNQCMQLNIPYVFINSDIPNCDNMCYFGPNLYQSGYMAAHLFDYILNESDKILIVNVSNLPVLLRKEEGFRNYFKDNNKVRDIIKVDVQNAEYRSVEKDLALIFNEHPDCNAVFVTSSRVSTVAKYLEESGRADFTLVGFDFLAENIEYLKKNTIDFLICQKPEEQGYKGLMALYYKMVHRINAEKVNFMPIDIISRENHMFYHN